MNDNGCGFKLGDVVIHKASLMRMVVMDVADRHAGLWIFRPLNPACRWQLTCRYFHERRSASGRHTAYESDYFWDFEVRALTESEKRGARIA